MTKNSSKSWVIEFAKRAEKSFAKMDMVNKKRIIDFFETKVAKHSNPRIHGKQLSGNHKDKWSYRVGEYRILTHIIDEKMIILALDIGHRKEIYKTYKL